MNNIKSVEVDSNLQEEPEMTFHSVHLHATDIKAIYAISPPMMAEINVAESGNIMFECDTAASHNILSKKVYSRLRGKHPDRIPVMKHDKITVRLADGSISKRHSGVINVKVQGNETKARVRSAGAKVNGYKLQLGI